MAIQTITEGVDSKRDKKNIQEEDVDGVLLRKNQQQLLELIQVHQWVGLQLGFFLTSCRLFN